MSHDLGNETHLYAWIDGQMFGWMDGWLETMALSKTDDLGQDN